MPWGPEVILQIDGHNLWGLSDEAMAADLVSERERESCGNYKTAEWIVF